MLTFVGEGYDAAFIANYKRIAARLSAGEEIEIVSGPDDICAPLLGCAEPHCLRPGPAARDERAARSLGHMLGMPIGPGNRIFPDDKLIRRLRRSFASDLIRDACDECEWSELCSAVAQRNFSGGLVLPAQAEAGKS